MTDLGRLEELAEGVSDSYPDFVRWVRDSGRIYGIGEQIASFIEANPDATTSDILRYEREITGMTEPLEIIDG